MTRSILVPSSLPAKASDHFDSLTSHAGRTADVVGRMADGDCEPTSATAIDVRLESLSEFLANSLRGSCSRAGIYHVFLPPERWEEFFLVLRSIGDEIEARVR